MSYGAESVRDEYVLSPERQDDLIEDLVGIRPDVRGRIPGEEIRSLVIGVQRGDPEAQERLIATRLHWAYDRAFDDDIRDRHDLTLADVLQTGAMATLEAARSMNTANPNVNVLLHTALPQHMERFLVGSKLVSTVSENGQVLKISKSHPGLIADKVELVEESEITEMSGEDPSDDVPEYMLAVGIERFLEDADLTYKQRAVLRMRYGDLEDTARPRVFSKPNKARDDVSMSLDDIADHFDLTKQGINIIEKTALAKLRAELSGEPRQPDTGEPIPVPTPEQIAKRHAWLEEIRSKQDRGEIAFVRGSLRRRPIPAPIHVYLITGTYKGITAFSGPAAALKAAVEASRYE